MSTTVTTNNKTPLTYNEEFEVTTYPIQQKHLDALDAIAAIMVASGGRWWYQATIHGRVLDYQTEDTTWGYHRRLSILTMQALMAIPGFRWIDINENGFSIGLEH